MTMTERSLAVWLTFNMSKETLRRLASLSLALLAAVPAAGAAKAPATSAIARPESSDTVAALKRLRANFQNSATPATPSHVRLVKTAKSRDTVTVSVVLDGPTPGIDIYSWAFDLALSGVPVEYVAGSAVAGNALVPGPGQGISAQAVQVGNRVIVGVSKLSGGSGSVLTTSQVTIVSLKFRVLAKGKTLVSFAGPPAPAPNSSPAGPAALDSNGGVIDAIIFDAAVGVIVGKKVS